MRYYIIAGEASGDLHGSNLMKGIYAEDPQADIRFWGGDLMESVWKSHTSLAAGGGSGFTDRATPLAAGGGTRDGVVGGVVLTTAPHRFHQIAAPEADFRLRIFCVYPFHQIRPVKVSRCFACYDIVSHVSGKIRSSSIFLLFSVCPVLHSLCSQRCGQQR